jgi:DNA mismatch repair protein MutS2
MNKRSMRILGFYQVQNMLVQLTPSRLSKEIARRLRPSSDETEIRQMLNDTEEAYLCLQREVSTPFGGITDIRPALEKAKREVTLDGQECVDIWNNMERYSAVQAYFADRKDLYPHLYEQAQSIGEFSFLSHKMAQVFDQNHQIRDNAPAQPDYGARTADEAVHAERSPE